ncbi:MAG: MAPEG family protein [Burkholderiaceae bacterium]
MLKVIPIYAALLAFFYVYLSARTIGVRRKAKISIGDGGDDEMLRAIRMHANFSEYAPITLILLAFVDLQGGPIWLLHSLGVLFVIARLSNAYGIRSVQAPGKFRVAGMVGTFTTIAVSAAWLLNAYLIAL